MPLHFQIDFKPTGTGRKIRGRITSPAVDRENEIIEPAAMRQALHNFMKHPILHLQHTERPVGIATAAVVKASGETYIEAEIFDTDDTDDVWEQIEKGTLNKYSIYGRRKQNAGPCHLSPHQRASPCVTKSLDLWSVSLVGSNAINQDTYLEIAKSILSEEDYPYFAENLGLIYKSESSNEYLKGDTMVPEPTKKTEETTDNPTDVDEAPVVKADNEGRLDTIESSLNTITKSIGDLTEIVKSVVVKPTAEETPDDADVKKAALDVETIVKARVDAAVGEIKKSFDAMAMDVETLKKAVAVMQDTVVRKSGPLVYIPEKDDEHNPYEANAAAIGA